jgi:hypothetical protein
VTGSTRLPCAGPQPISAQGATLAHHGDLVLASAAIFLIAVPPSAGEGTPSPWKRRRRPLAISSDCSSSSSPVLPPHLLFGSPRPRFHMLRPLVGSPLSGPAPLALAPWSSRLRRSPVQLRWLPLPLCATPVAARARNRGPTPATRTCCRDPATAATLAAFGWGRLQRERRRRSHEGEGPSVAFWAEG